MSLDFRNDLLRVEKLALGFALRLQRVYKQKKGYQVLRCYEKKPAAVEMLPNALGGVGWRWVALKCVEKRLGNLLFSTKEPFPDVIAGYPNRFAVVTQT